MTVLEEAPLTYALELLTEIDGWSPGRVLHARFIVHAAFRIAGPLDVAVLRVALGDVVARHGALRTVLLRDRQPHQQRVLAPMPARLEVHELDPATSAGDFVVQVCDRDYPFDDAPLLWAHLGRYDDERAVLVLVAHHIAADAWSLAVLARDIRAAYAARLAGAAPLGADVMQYTEIAADDRSAKWQARIADVQPYWRDRLSGVAELGLAVPTPGPPGVSGPTATLHFAVDDTLFAGIKAAARSARTTPFTLLLTAFTAAMFPAGDADTRDALVPVITAGRIPSEWETVGFLLNVLMIRVDRPAATDLPDLLRRVDRSCRQAYANDIPLLTVLRAVPELAGVLARRDRVLPLFQFIPRIPVRPPAGEPALELTPVSNDSRALEAIPQAMLFSLEADGELTGHVSYDTELFGGEWVHQRVDAFRSVLRELAAGS